MYLESTARRTADTSRRRGDCGKPARQTAARPQTVAAVARPSRLDDAIVAQWLLDQVPADHRHAFAATREELAA